MKTQSSLQRARAKLLAQLEQQQGMYEQACCALEFERERQKILAEFISTQVETERILSHHKALMGDGGDEAEDKTAAETAAGAAAEAVPDRCTNWMMAIMARVTKRHIRQALQLTAEDWIQLNRTGFQNSMLLLELYQRSEEPAADSCQDIQGQPYSQIDTPQQPGTACDTDKAQAASSISAAAAPAGSSLAVQGCRPPPEQPPEDPDAWTAPALTNLLDDSIDMLSLITAAMFHNPAPYYTAAACNQVTGQVATASSAHQRQVLRRLQLSRQQLLHLAIIASEFARLSRATRKEGNSLAEQTARLSLSALASSLEDETTVSQSGRQGSNQPSATAARAGSSELAAGSAGAAAAEERLAAAAGRDTGSSGLSRSGSATAAPSAGGSTGVPPAAASAAEVAAAVAAADESSRPGGQTAGPTAEELSQQLQRYLEKMNLHTVVTGWSALNTLTVRQVATLTVASFPFVSNVHATAEAALALYQQQQHQARPGSSSQGQRGGSGDDDDDDASAAWQQEVQEHMAHRSAVLETQLEQWWQQLLPPLQQDEEQQQQESKSSSPTGGSEE